MSKKVITLNKTVCSKLSPQKQSINLKNFNFL